VHCGTYAKNFYEAFFGTGETIGDRLTFQRFVGSSFEVGDKEKMRGVAEAVFRELFEEGIAEIGREGIASVRKLGLELALSSTEVVTNPP
jgi:L-amino acid N-acyltransferase YncA